MKRLAIIIALTASAIAQTTFKGATLSSATGGSSTTRTGYIYLLFPPASNISPDYANIRAAGSAWDNSLIDGVTYNLQLQNIKNGTNVASTTPQGNCVGWTQDTDTCVRVTSVNGQALAAPVYYPFSWTNQDSITQTFGVGYWFQQTPSGKYKTVNFNVVHQVSGATNTVTPDYVTTSTYINYFPLARQDVINAINTSITGQWTGNTNISGTGSGANATVVVAGNSYLQNETIFVKTTTSDHTYDCLNGCTITNVSGNNVTYVPTGGAPSGSISGLTVLSSAESFHVPYEQPYMAWFQASMKAVILHYNSTYVNPNVAGSSASQLGYVRFGCSVGGECVMFGYTQMLALSAPYTLAGETGNTPNTGDNCYSGGSCNTWGWTSYYNLNMKYVESLHPFMQVFTTGNSSGGATPQYFGFAKTEFDLASSRSNGAGLFQGIGEQGVSLFDVNAYNTNNSQTFTDPVNSQFGSCPGAFQNCVCGNYGCYIATQYGSQGMPIEIQQLSISAYDDGNCTTQAHGGGTPPNGRCAVPSATNGGDSGDLRQWLKFWQGSPVTDPTAGGTVTLPGHATVLELYYRDAALALDPNFVTLAGGGGSATAGYTTQGNGYTWYSWNNGTGTGYQYTAFQNVGLSGANNNCIATYTSASPQAGSTGDCSYAAALAAFHGQH